jgi:2-dehydropantoate 2-reductase
MKILVFGAGVLGSVYAARLTQAGHEVTVLARGRRLAELRQYGIVLEEGRRQVCIPVQVIDHLAPSDGYDLALVVVRKNQLDGVLPSLAANPNIPDLLFLFNNPAGPQEMVRAVGRRRVLIGFPGGGGQRTGHVVRYLLSGRNGQPTTIGELDGQTTPRLLKIAEMLEGAGFPVQLSPTMDAWLKTHFALTGPVANAVYLAGGDPHRLSRTRDGLLLLVRAAREGLQVLHALGIPVVPERLRLLEWVPEPLLVALLQRAVTSERFELAVVCHAMAARDELQHLEEEFRFLVRLSGVPSPALDALAEYVDPQTPLMPDGQSHLHREWRGLWALLAGGAAAILVLRRLVRG